MVTIQNLVNDQRRIMHHSTKPHPSMFVQNAITDYRLTSENTNVWIENSHVGAHWKLTHDHVITGVPENDFHVSLSPGQCVDVVPIGEHSWAVRCYHIDDKFAGAAQQEKRFPVVDSVEKIGKCIIQSPSPSGGVGEGVVPIFPPKISPLRPTCTVW